MGVYSNMFSGFGFKIDTNNLKPEHDYWDFYKIIEGSILNRTDSEYAFARDSYYDKHIMYVGWFQTSSRNDDISFIGVEEIPSKEEISKTILDILGDFAYLLDQDTFGYYSGVVSN